MIRPARYWVLPVRGPPNTTSTSSTEIHTRSRPTRHSCKPTSAVGRASSCHHRARRVEHDVREGRTVAALRRIATPDPTRATSKVEATPDLRRVRAPQRVTVAEVRENRCQATPTASRARAASSHSGRRSTSWPSGHSANSARPTNTSQARRR